MGGGFWSVAEEKERFTGFAELKNAAAVPNAIVRSRREAGIVGVSSFAKRSWRAPYGDRLTIRLDITTPFGQEVAKES